MNVVNNEELMDIRWTRRCRDWAFRPRTASVAVERGDILLGLPAGGMAVLDRQDVADLDEVLAASITEARGEGTTTPGA